MEKSLAIKINDFKIKLIKEINEAALPPCVIEMIIKDIYNQVEAAAQTALQKDYEEYQKNMNKSE